MIRRFVLATIFPFIFLVLAFVCGICAISVLEVEGLISIAFSFIFALIAIMCLFLAYVSATE